MVWSMREKQIPRCVPRPSRHATAGRDGKEKARDSVRDDTCHFVGWVGGTVTLRAVIVFTVSWLELAPRR